MPAYRHGLIPILCFGEGLEVREPATRCSIWSTRGWPRWSTSLPSRPPRSWCWPTNWSGPSAPAACHPGRCPGGCAAWPWPRWPSSTPHRRHGSGSLWRFGQVRERRRDHRPTGRRRRAGRWRPIDGTQLTLGGERGGSYSQTSGVATAGPGGFAPGSWPLSHPARSRPGQPRRRPRTIGPSGA